MSSGEQKEFFASALQCNSVQDTKLLAKGHGDIGRHIARLADEHDIPVLKDLELSKELSQIPLGENIPDPLFIAIATLFGYLWELEKEAENTK